LAIDLAVSNKNKSEEDDNNTNRPRRSPCSRPRDAETAVCTRAAA
jgi:hypothetical protein